MLDWWIWTSRAAGLSAATLVQRYDATRRKHPRAEEAGGVLEAIEYERGLFDPECPLAVPNDIGMSVILTSPAYLLALGMGNLEVGLLSTATPPIQRFLVRDMNPFRALSLKGDGSGAEGATGRTASRAG